MFSVRNSYNKNRHFVTLKHSCTTDFLMALASEKISKRSIYKTVSSIWTTRCHSLSTCSYVHACGRMCFVDWQLQRLHNLHTNNSTSSCQSSYQFTSCMLVYHVHVVSYMIHVGSLAMKKAGEKSREEGRPVRGTIMHGPLWWLWSYVCGHMSMMAVVICPRC